MDLEENFPLSEGERMLELQMFRERWKAELLNGASKDQSDHIARGGSASTSRNQPKKRTEQKEATASRSKFEIAAEIFQEGIKEERSGRLYEAISLYKRAMQLDPDIEFKFEKQIDKRKISNDALQTKKEDVPSSPEDILDSLKKYNPYESGVCEADLDIEATHIGDLPYEIVQYLTQWVVSSELDLLSLERFAMVCRGFYRTAREDNIWRLACLRIWTELCGTPKELHYGSWREMFIHRPQVRFNGLYISRYTYIRRGEASFIDNSVEYQAYYTVQYFRFFRFFADGTVLYANTPEEPAAIVPRLRDTEVAQNKDSGSGQILRGHYEFSSDGSSVTVYMKREKQEEFAGRTYKRRTKKKIEYDILTMELNIRDSRERQHGRLDWRKYSITRVLGHTETTSAVDVHQHFPPLYYSRVKSYTSQSEQPLL